MVDIARSAAAFGIFRLMLRAARVTGLEAELRGSAPMTALLVTDDVLGRAGTGPLHDTDAWAAFLRAHLVAGAWSAEALAGEAEITTLAGTRLAVSSAGRLALAGVQVIQADVRCANGVLHVLERPLVTMVAGGQAAG